MVSIKYEEWFEIVYRDNITLLEKMARSFVMKKMNCDNQTYIRYADHVAGEIQESYMILWEKRENLYRHKNIVGWLYNTISNRLMHFIRNSINESKRSAFSMDNEEVPGDAIVNNTRQDGEKDPLVMESYMDTLKRLVGKQNAELYYGCKVERQSVKEMARYHGMTENAVWTRISRIQDTLHKHKNEFL